MEPCGGARALEELAAWSRRRWRVAPRGGRLADGEADLALRQREAGHGVHQEHDVLALVAEVLGDRGGHEAPRGARGGPGRVATSDRAREAFLPRSFR